MAEPEVLPVVDFIKEEALEKKNKRAKKRKVTKLSQIPVGDPSLRTRSNTNPYVQNDDIETLEEGGLYPLTLCALHFDFNPFIQMPLQAEVAIPRVSKVLSVNCWRRQTQKAMEFSPKLKRQRARRMVTKTHS